MEPNVTKAELDRVDAEIRQLIAAESDHKDKGMLLLMQSINRNLTENTLATIRVADGIQHINVKVESHVTEFQQWKNTGMGVYKTGIVFVAIIQVLMTAAVGMVSATAVGHLKTSDEDHAVITQLVAAHTAFTTRLDLIDRRMDTIMGQLIESERAKHSQLRFGGNGK
jgi:hypothetical protein